MQDRQGRFDLGSRSCCPDRSGAGLISFFRSANFMSLGEAVPFFHSACQPHWIFLAALDLHPEEFLGGFPLPGLPCRRLRRFFLDDHLFPGPLSSIAALIDPFERGHVPSCRPAGRLSVGTVFSASARLWSAAKAWPMLAARINARDNKHTFRIFSHGYFLVRYSMRRSAGFSRAYFISSATLKPISW